MNSGEWMDICTFYGCDLAKSEALERVKLSIGAALCHESFHNLPCIKIYLYVPYPPAFSK